MGCSCIFKPQRRRRRAVLALLCESPRPSACLVFLNEHRGRGRKKRADGRSGGCAVLDTLSTKGGQTLARGLQSVRRFDRGATAEGWRSVGTPPHRRKTNVMDYVEKTAYLLKMNKSNVTTTCKIHKIPIFCHILSLNLISTTWAGRIKNAQQAACGPRAVVLPASALNVLFYSLFCQSVTSVCC